MGDCVLSPRAFARLFAWQQVEVDLFCAPEAMHWHPETGGQLAAVSPYPKNKQLGLDGPQFYSEKILMRFRPLVYCYM